MAALVYSMVYTSAGIYQNIPEYTTREFPIPGIVPPRGHNGNPWRIAASATRPRSARRACGGQAARPGRGRFGGGQLSQLKRAARHIAQLGTQDPRYRTLSAPLAHPYLMPIY